MTPVEFTRAEFADLSGDEQDRVYGCLLCVAAARWPESAPELIAVYLSHRGAQRLRFLEKMFPELLRRMG